MSIHDETWDRPTCEHCQKEVPYGQKLFHRQKRCMNKPKTIYLPENASHTGIDITYIKSKSELRIGGWFDSMVGISGGSISLKDFFFKLGITKQQCVKAFN